MKPITPQMEKDSAILWPNSAESLMYENKYLKEENEYFKNQIAELRDIINHLFFNYPTDFEYIHPFDLCELIENSQTTVDMIKRGESIESIEVNTKDHSFFTIDGQKYKQTPNMPAKTTKYK